MPDPAAGDFPSADDWLESLDDHEGRITDLEALAAPLPGRITSLDTTVGNILGNTLIASAVGTTDGGGVLHVTFSDYGAPSFDATPIVVAGMGDFTGTSFACQVVHSSVDTDGFDVLITKFPDTGGEGASGETVRVNFLAAGPWS